MACGMLHPAGAAAAALWPRLPVPLPRRNSTTKEHPHPVPCRDQFRWKLPLSGNAIYYSSVIIVYRTSVVHGGRSRGLICCTSSGSSAEVAALNRPADVSGGGRSDQSVRRCVDSAPGALVVISGYWTGPDVDDGCGSIEAVLQRIV
ncbi:hypothetical protein PR202_ga28850 [Eleusine coracana subsp. coracana]|uniref:Uncharacterized protein n=1 Tax=Eleusine coracana subsp. coracana TaxID=191504 RepID=A0AAV5DK98_ELECO|nr:hypothetical protein PR202_ga28850 [Eleusine coracana subsp. coracana]